MLQDGVERHGEEPARDAEQQQAEAALTQGANVLVLDLQMPGMHGGEVARRIKLGSDAPQPAASGS